MSKNGENNKINNGQRIIEECMENNLVISNLNIHGK